MTKTDPQRLRELRARRRAMKIGYRLTKVLNVDSWRLLYTLAGQLATVESYLADRRRV